MINQNIRKTIDNLVWWIPLKNFRNQIRELLLNYYESIDFLKSDFNILNNKINRIIDIYNKLEINRRYNELTAYNEDYYYKKRVFKENVQHVEIGISSFCNRKCWFCPNSIIDRYSKNIELKEDLFLKLLRELKEINYSNKVFFHRYNEPLYNKELLIKRLKQAREYLPQSYIHIVTNGDYLTLDYLKELKNAGVNEISVSFYYNGNDKSVPFNIENIIKPKMMKFLNRLNLNYSIFQQTKDWCRLKSEYEDIDIELVSANFENLGTDRGGILKDNINIVNRVSPCILTNFQIVVDYDADYTLCCNIRSDTETNKNYILGNIETHSVFDIFMGEKAVNFRKELLIEGTKKGPCAHCSDRRDLTNWIPNF